MINTIPSYFSDMPLYNKAMDIIVLSQNISTYLNQDLNYIDDDGREDPNIYFSGDIVQQSNSLAPEIMNAEREKFSEKKYKHIERIDRLTSLLYKNCKRLEKANSNGKDYLSILRTELKTFRLLKNNWMLTL
ncbi:hypothetical protein [Winogradskyella immobilis]|uniref:Uncharacterized protein n=1 Tax=Winogradskyella immobilis TaxID=2816852 RepID=A0ABS8EQA4_9FLAO|nr:hypothetical protein [Winogradskyella immobilis]MCC1484482.1 hypothetical protein [Winogradskyella immobilis]MCG0016574.1 hypothetical protein [Winogradskyella immobilis]